MAMINIGKHLPRRSVLRGLGATLALPLLDGMIPAFTAIAKTAAKPVCRFGAVYVPNGVSMASWTPKAEGDAFELTPSLEALAPHRNRLVVLSGMCNKEADGRPGEGLGDHSRAQAAFLTGVHARKTEGADLRNGTSIDQIVAKHYAQHTQLASLELALESNDLAGGCEDGYSCAYVGTIAWRSETTPLPMESDPRAAFERLFGASQSTDRQARIDRVERDRSILDAVAEQLTGLERRLGVRDRAKLTEYLDSVRDVERRIQRAEEQSDRELPILEQPPGVPGSFEEYAGVMFDLMALAYQCDLTRVATFLMGREKSVRTFPEIGVPEPHHTVSHHGFRPEWLAKQAKVNAFHAKLFANFVEKLRSTPDGDGSLLDHSLIVYGYGMSNSDSHLHHDLPILLVGGGAGQVKGGRHLRLPDETPLANLHMTVLDKIGVPVEQLGDSTGKIELLSGV